MRHRTYFTVPREVLLDVDANAAGFVTIRVKGIRSYIGYAVLAEDIARIGMALRKSFLIFLGPIARHPALKGCTVWIDSLRRDCFRSAISNNSAQPIV